MGIHELELKLNYKSYIMLTIIIYSQKRFVDKKQYHAEL